MDTCKIKLNLLYTTLHDYKVYLQVIKRYANNTVELYYKYVDSFVNFILNNKKYKSYNIISNIIFQEFILFLKETSNISNRTISIIIAAINNFFKFMCIQYECCKIRKIKQIRFLCKNKMILNQKNLLKLLDSKNPSHFSESLSWIYYRNYALGMLLYSTGIRIGEAMFLTLSDLDEEWIRIENTKNKEVRVVPMVKITYDALLKYRDMCPFQISKIFWYNRKGKKLTERAASMSVKNMFGYSAHYFRHAFATHLAINGCELSVLKDFLGHKSLATTSIYMHLQPRHLQKTVQLYHPINKEIF